jgi:hypothetical protein
MNLCPSSHNIFLAWVGAAETDARLVPFTWRWKQTSQARNQPGLRPVRTWAVTWPGSTGGTSFWSPAHAALTSGACQARVFFFSACKRWQGQHQHEFGGRDGSTVSSRGDQKYFWVASCTNFSDTVLLQVYCFSFSACLMLLCSSIKGRTENY